MPLVGLALAARAAHVPVTLAVGSREPGLLAAELAEARRRGAAVLEVRSPARLPQGLGELPRAGDAGVCGPPAFNDSLLAYLAGSALRVTELPGYTSSAVRI